MKKVSSTIVKKRSRELTSVFEAFTPHDGLEGRTERVWITEIAADGNHLVKLLIYRNLVIDVEGCRLLSKFIAVPLLFYIQ